MLPEENLIHIFKNLHTNFYFPVWTKRQSKKKECLSYGWLGLLKEMSRCQCRKMRLIFLAAVKKMQRLAMILG